MFTKNKKNNKGFTLVETLVAISVLSISILGTFTATQSGLSQSVYAKDQISANYLVQEAMEFIRNVRDENALINLTSTGSISWLSGLSDTDTDPCYFGKKCNIDSFKGKNFGGIYECSADNCSLYQDTDTTNPTYGLFGDSSHNWPISRFKREITLTSVSSYEIIVTVNVIWDKGNIKVNQSLFNIR